MELSLPVDVYVLRVMSDGDPTNPVRVRHLIDDRHADELATEWERDPWTRAYISQVMTRLKDRELLERVPPENSGLYRITDLGYAALAAYQNAGRTEFSFRELIDLADDLDNRAPVARDVTFRPPA